MITLILISVFYMVKSKMYVAIPGGYTFDEGQSKCTQMGGQLATWDNDDEWNQIKDARAIIGNNGHYWVGLDDRGAEHSWRFIDGHTHYCAPQGTGLDCADLPMWAPNEPNNVGGNQDCALIWRYYGITLDDDSCGQRYGFICEFSSGGCTPSICCVNDCTGMATGNYQSCSTCNGYVACSNTNKYDMPCADSIPGTPPLVWDDNK
eukprot:UN04307